MKKPEDRTKDIARASWLSKNQIKWVCKYKSPLNSQTGHAQSMHQDDMEVLASITHLDATNGIATPLLCISKARGKKIIPKIQSMYIANMVGKRSSRLGPSSNHAPETSQTHFFGIQ